MYLLMGLTDMSVLQRVSKSNWFALKLCWLVFYQASIDSIPIRLILKNTFKCKASMIQHRTLTSWFKNFWGGYIPPQMLTTYLNYQVVDVHPG